MGMTYNFCDFKNKEIESEEQLFTYNMLSNKKFFFRNNNINIKRNIKEFFIL